MLMYDRPPAADFAKANGQAKIELDFIPVRLRSTVVLLLLALIWISLKTKWKSSSSPKLKYRSYTTIASTCHISQLRSSSILHP